MKVAYSIAGEGFGHAARMVCLAPRLLEKVELHLFCPQTVQGYVRGRLPDVPIRDIPHFGFVKRGDRVLVAATIVSALRRFPGFLRQVVLLARLLRAESFDAVISDFDPYLAWAGRLAGLRVVQINHPGIITKHLSLNPRSWPAALAALLLEGPWHRRIHCSFYQGDVGPLLRPELLNRPRSRSGSWVLHLKPEYREWVVPALEQAGLVPYDIYPKAGGDFDAALASARGVISSAGHQIISEALVLGKPILVIPQGGQYEQALNARQLEKTERGMVGSRRNLEARLRRFRFWAESFSRQEELGFLSPFTDDTSRAVQLLKSYLDEVALPFNQLKRNSPSVEAKGVIERRLPRRRRIIPANSGLVLSSVRGTNRVFSTNSTSTWTQRGVSRCALGSK